MLEWVAISFSRDRTQASHMQADALTSEPPGKQYLITSWEIDGETVETVSDFIFGAPKSLQMVIAVMKLKEAYSLEGKF